MKHVAACALAASAALSSASAGPSTPHAQVEVDIKLGTSVPSGNSNGASPVRLTGDSAGVLNHFYNHIVGLASPSGYNPSAKRPEDGFTAFQDLNIAPALPATNAFQRPQASLLFAVEGLGAASNSQDSPAVLSGGSRYAADVSPGFNHLLTRSAARRGGLSRHSLDVLHTEHGQGLGNHAASGGSSSNAIRWTSSAGFVSSSSSSSSSVDADYLGVIACKASGQQALKKLGFEVTGRGTGSCPTYTFTFNNGALSGNGNGQWEGAEKVKLDAGASPSVTQGLSEAALSVLVGEHTAALLESDAAASRLERAPGVLLHRLNFNGLEQAAQEHGTASKQFRALSAAVRRGIALADETVRAKSKSGEVATMVVGIAPGVLSGDHGKTHGHAAVDAKAAPRLLQTSIVANGTSYYTQGQIADSQLFLWTWISLLAVAGVTVYFIASANPDAESDPALFGAEVSTGGSGSGGAHHRAN